MQETIIELIKEYTDTFFITKTQPNKSVIMLIFGYSPFELLNKKEYAQIDAYYFLSNSTYHKAKELAKKLTNLGINSEYIFNLNYKKLSQDADFAGVGKNTLCYLQNLGSRFVMQAIEVEGQFSYIPLNTKLQPACENCDLCKNTCPTGAINDDGFDYKKCLRHMQEAGEYICDTSAKAMQNKLLGCDICQAVCPYNKAQTRVKIDEELKSLLKLDNLLEIVKNQDKIKENFTQKLGKNYAKQNMLLPTLILITGNSNNTSLLPKLTPFKTHNNELILKNLKRTITILEADKNL